MATNRRGGMAGVRNVVTGIALKRKHQSPRHTGVDREYVVIRPAYFVASLAPPVSGYTVEDAIFGDPQPIHASQ